VKAPSGLHGREDVAAHATLDAEERSGFGRCRCQNTMGANEQSSLTRMPFPPDQAAPPMGQSSRHCAGVSSSSSRAPTPLPA